MHARKGGRYGRAPEPIALMLLASLCLGSFAGLLVMIAHGDYQGGLRVGLWLLDGTALGVGLWAFVAAVRADG